MKKKITNILLAVVFLIGLSLLLYPTVSEKWNARFQAKVISTYTQAVDTVDELAYTSILSEAYQFNASILRRENRFALSEEEEAAYAAALSLPGTDAMAQIEIPRLDLTLAIYHGTDDSILQYGIGHVDWSSLPVGGESTHCVISGHRGLPSARLFTDLDEVEVGDVFYIHVLNETLTYEVEEILIVEPDDVSSLQIVEGKDLCTLVTCTPYGINTHRLLVRGHRVTEAEEETHVYINGDAVTVDPLIVAPLLLVPFLLAVLVWFAVRDLKKRKN